jgi:protease-4
MFLLGLARGTRIAVVEIEGMIGPAVRPADYGRLFRALERNPRVRAVVLDIDSPGGSATASDFLYLATKSLSARKPVVAFIRGTGASGAYMLSCAADRIVAIPSAIIGSIGVISIRPLLYEALRRIGVRMRVTKSDRFKDMGSMFREPTREERAKEQALVDELHRSFVEVVAQGRRLELAAAQRLATGEVFTAARGHELGLVDELGDLERAIDLAAELGRTARRPTWVRPRRGLRELIAPMLGGSLVDAIVDRIEQRLSNAFYYVYRA